jgi:hypothetical protein
LVAKDANKRGNNPGGTTKISVKPDTVRVKEGCDFVINNPGGHEISMSGTAPWLNKGPTTGDLTSEIAAKTVAGSAGDELFKYKIVVKDIGELDPRARVF